MLLGPVATSTPNTRGIRGQKKPVGRVSNWEMELLAQKFPLRGEVLGEDRFLNRYFLVPTALGVPRIFVEAFCQINQDLLDQAEAVVNGYLHHSSPGGGVSTDVIASGRRGEEEGRSCTYTSTRLFNLPVFRSCLLAVLVLAVSDNSPAPSDAQSDCWRNWSLLGIGRRRRWRGSGSPPTATAAAAGVRGRSRG